MSPQQWTSPDPWFCYCGATGLGGRPAHEQHVTDFHAPKLEPAPVVSATVPLGVDPKAVRAWAVTNGWPALAGKNGRIPAAAIGAYLKEYPCPPR